MSPTVGKTALWLGVPLALAAGGLWLPEFFVTLLNYIGLYALVALGLVLLTGVAGITSFGQAAFVGLGAYTSAVATLYFGASPWLGLFAGLALTTIAALIVGGVTLRLSGHYLPLGTICWSVSLYYVFGNLEILGGHSGMTGIPPISMLGLVLNEGREMFYLIWAVTLTALLVTSNALDSRPGRSMRALKNIVQTAEGFGVDAGRTKLAVFVYAALLASLSGWLYVHMLRFVNPTPFSIGMGIEYLFMAVVGGAGHVWGAVLGSTIITLLREYLQDLMPALLGRSGNFEIIAFGALVILLLQANGDRGFGALLDRIRPGGRNAMPKDAPPLPSRVHEAASADAPLLEVRGVTKRFGGLIAVDSISFSVGRREIVALIGPNGAGKSTLFDLVTGMQPIDQGEVRSGGTDIGRLPRNRMVHHGIARTYQHVHLVPDLSVLENAMLGAHTRGTRGPIAAGLGLNAAEESMLRCEAARQIERVGLGAVLNEPAGSLALGQQRLVEIARALCADPILLLLDEPAAGLRYGEKEGLADLLRKLRDAGMSVLVVEHDMQFVMNLADRIVVMNFGRKLAEGLPQDIRSNADVLEAYLGAKAA